MSEIQFCIRCGKKLPVGINFCPYCGVSLAAQVAAAPPAAQAKPQGDLFYVFAVQGPAFGSPSGDIVLEKANKLKAGFSNAENMELRLVRPSMWNARMNSSSTGGVVSVSYSMDSFKSEIRGYLKKEGYDDDEIEAGIIISDENSLQLSNPMSGVFVMGIPIIKANDAGSTVADSVGESEEKREEAPAAVKPCSHQFHNYVCTKCEEKAPKPQLTALGIRSQGQYTYEYYRAESVKEAKYFLEQTEVFKPFYYVMVETPQGKWGRDKDGLFLEQLCAFQHNLSLARCEASASIMPVRMADMQMAANKITDNYLLSVTCGKCGFEWEDGVGYRTKTVVKCPECGTYNIVNTEKHQIQ